MKGEELKDVCTGLSSWSGSRGLWRRPGVLPSRFNPVQNQLREASALCALPGCTRFEFSEARLEALDPSRLFSLGSPRPTCDCNNEGTDVSLKTLVCPLLFPEARTEFECQGMEANRLFGSVRSWTVSSEADSGV